LLIVKRRPARQINSLKQIAFPIILIYYTVNIFFYQELQLFSTIIEVGGEDEIYLFLFLPLIFQHVHRWYGAGRLPAR
jgi:hypothetical protein